MSGSGLTAALKSSQIEDGFVRSIANLTTPTLKENLMKIRVSTFLVPSLLLLSLLVVVSTGEVAKSSTNKHRLAMEIALEKPWTVNAAVDGYKTGAFVRIPAAAANKIPYAAIKLMPKMVGDKMEVTLSGLSGDVTGVKTCSDWAQLKETFLATYTLSAGQEVSVSQLSNLGPNFKNGMLTFRAIMSEEEPGGEAGCGCGKCGSLVCCPNAGHCLGCGDCGSVCCLAT